MHYKYPVHGNEHYCLVSVDLCSVFVSRVLCQRPKCQTNFPLQSVRIPKQFAKIISKRTQCTTDI
jgi:hypothetical protein